MTLMVTSLPASMPNQSFFMVVAFNVPTPILCKYFVSLPLDGTFKCENCACSLRTASIASSKIWKYNVGTPRRTLLAAPPRNKLNRLTGPSLLSVRKAKTSSAPEATAWAMPVSSVYPPSITPLTCTAARLSKPSCVRPGRVAMSCANASASRKASPFGADDAQGVNSPRMKLFHHCRVLLTQAPPMAADEAVATSTTDSLPTSCVMAGNAGSTGCEYASRVRWNSAVLKYLKRPRRAAASGAMYGKGADAFGPVPSSMLNFAGKNSGTAWEPCNS
mmetsp:Transcript_88542/g.271042  ORF Transcript_88542/g.271042 Transcript_88542/m.271042 type:complete len:276 (-) Transcript_88542:570-1397(-)